MPSSPRLSGLHEQSWRYSHVSRDPSAENLPHCAAFSRPLQVARALNQNAPTLHTVERGYGLTPEQMFLREFNWRLTQEELEGGLEIYDRTVRCISCRVLSCRVMSCPVIPYRVVPCHLMSYHDEAPAKERVLVPVVQQRSDALRSGHIDLVAFLGGGARGEVHAVCLRRTAND